MTRQTRKTNCSAGREADLPRRAALPALALATALLGGCIVFEPQPQPRLVTATAPSNAVPVDSPIALEEVYAYTGPRFNQLGGEVPRASPSPQVDEVAIEDVPTG